MFPVTTSSVWLVMIGLAVGWLLKKVRWNSRRTNANNVHSPGESTGVSLSTGAARGFSNVVMARATPTAVDGPSSVTGSGSGAGTERGATVVSTAAGLAVVATPASGVTVVGSALTAVDSTLTSVAST